MKRMSLLLISGLVLIGLGSCKKDCPETFTSLLDIQTLQANEACPNGGIVVKTGLDRNRNNALDESEVETTKNVCNGQNGQSNNDKQILLPINWSANTTNTTPVIGGQLLKFSKLNYPGVDSIILVTNAYVGDASNTSIVELYNITDNVPITNSTITTNNLYSATGFLQTGNLYGALPDKEITVGISLRSGTAGKFAATGDPYLILYRR
jgi:hypothetical protein